MKTGSRRTVDLPETAADALLQTMPPGLPGASLLTRPDGSELPAHPVHFARKSLAGRQVGRTRSSTSCVTRD